MSPTFALCRKVRHSPADIQTFSPCRFTSGYINTCAFILAPQLVPPALASKAGGAMALTFQIASLCALVAAWLVQLLMRRG